ncbi:MAG: DUF2716 domain-containing protein [Clostridia bacterium]|nr:DUF2716 domain-containing protein [Clostridia bacterium]
MKKIENMQEYDVLWNQIIKSFSFKPDSSLILQGKSNRIFTIKELPFKVYKIDDCCCGDEKWQQNINAILKKIIDADMYALDWQHDAFVFNPNENVTLEQSGWGGQFG